MENIMTIKVIHTKTRPSIDVDFGHIPSEVNMKDYLDFYKSREVKAISREEQISPDGLTMIIIARYNSIDDYLMEDVEGPARDSSWQLIKSARMNLGLTDSFQVLDEDNDQIIDGPSINARISTHIAEGQIPN
jgi:hypothetical protein